MIASKRTPIVKATKLACTAAM